MNGTFMTLVRRELWEHRSLIWAPLAMALTIIVLSLVSGAVNGGMDIQLGEEFRRASAYAEIQRYLSGGAGAKTALSSVPMDADLKRPVPADRRARRDSRLRPPLRLKRARPDDAVRRPQSPAGRLARPAPCADSG